MSSTGVLTPDVVLRDHNIDGVPSSGEYEVEKALLRDYLRGLETAIATGAKIVATKAELDGGA